MRGSKVTHPTDSSEKGISVRVDAEGERPASQVLEAPAPRAREVRELPFCIAVLGDFSGRGGAGRGGDRPGAWTPLRVTPDNMPGLAGLEAALDLRMSEGSSSTVELRFESLSDFHPDTIFGRLPLFAELREARAAVAEGRTPDFGRGGGAGDGEGEGATESEAEGREETAPSSRGAPGDELLDAILEETKPRGSSDGSSRGPEDGASTGARLDAELREFVREVVEPHRVRPAPDRSGELADIDRAASALMRRVLRHDRFRSLESLWRSLVFLLSRIDSGPEVRVYLVDVARGELEEDLVEAEDPTRSRLHRLLTSPDLGFPGGRWALVVGAYSFGADPDEVPLLTGIARVARSADVPWISAARARIAGCDDLAEAPDPGGWSAPWRGPWRRLPAAPEARWLGLALPRFLAREPYGSDSGRRCRAFDFEEAPRGGPPETQWPSDGRFLPWGNPAFVCAALLARSFAREGWGFSPNAGLELGQVPVAPGRSSGDPDVLVTEHHLSSSSASRLAEVGIMPLVAFPDRALVRVGGIRSVADPPAGLHGWWVP